MTSNTARLLERLRNVDLLDDYARIEAADLIERMQADRLKLDAKIRAQRRALRDNWQIVDQRIEFRGGRRYRELYLAMLHRFNDLRKQVEATK